MQPGNARPRRHRAGPAALELERLEPRLLLSADGLELKMPALFLPPVERERSRPAPSDPAGSPPGQAPFGANLYDTSEFMIGDVYVTVVLLESDGTVDPETEDWTAAEIDKVKSEVQEGLSWWEHTYDSYPDVAPLNDLTFFVDFTYADTPIQTGYEPISRPHGDQTYWINDFLDAVGYNSSGSIWADLWAWNDGQRRANDADWAYTTFVVDSSADSDGMSSDGYFAYAYLGGPFTVMTYDNDGWGISRMGNVLAHETAHMFYALDEYPGSHSYTAHSGYHNTQNLNA